MLTCDGYRIWFRFSKDKSFFCAKQDYKYTVNSGIEHAFRYTIKSIWI